MKNTDLISKKTIGWGTRILILYLGFVALIVALVTMSMKQKTDLVSKDYYARELAYQNTLDKMNRARALSKPVLWQLSNGRLVLQFPDELLVPINGKIYLYCPSGADRDLQRTFSIAAHQVEIDVTGAQGGQYQLQIDWQAGTQTYYQEAEIRIP